LGSSISIGMETIRNPNQAFQATLNSAPERRRGCLRSVLFDRMEARIP
jgi:hypothetical protein